MDGRVASSQNIATTREEKLTVRAGTGQSFLQEEFFRLQKKKDFVCSPLPWF